MNLKDISGVGEKTVIDLNKLGIFDVEDLVTYYPKRYFVIKRSDIGVVANGDKIIVDGVVGSIPVFSNVNGKLKKFVFRLLSNNNIFNIVVFNQFYLCKNLRVGDKIIVIGKYDKYKNSITVSEIRSGIIEGVKVESIYSVGNFNKKSFSRLINKVLDSNIEIEDYKVEILLRKRD